MLLAGLMSFVVVALILPFACSAARRLGFVDIPEGKRKMHKTPTPPIGGLVIIPVFIVGLLLSGATLQIYWPLIAGLVMLLSVGAWDDYRYTPPWPKFTAQILAAATIVMLGGVKIVHLGNIFGLGPLGLNIFAVPFSIIAVVLFINAVNLMDGLDGLAGGYAFSVFTWLLVMNVAHNQNAMLMPLSLLCGCMLGFLVHNIRSPVTPKARVFLGDAGSLCLALLISWFAIHTGQIDMGAAIPPIVIAWFLALPIMDTCAQFYRRVREGRSPFSADRGHFHHQFIDAGLSVTRTVWILLLLINICGGGAYILTMIGVPEVILTILWIGALFTHIALSQKIGTYTNIIRRLFG